MRGLLQPIVTGSWRAAKAERALATLPQIPIWVEREPAPPYSSFVNGGIVRAMEKTLHVSSADRWEWYGAGDKTIAPCARPRAWPDTDPDRVTFEIGLSFAAPLLLAAIAGVIFA